MAIYANFGNGKIKGDVTAAGYEGWVEIQSYSMGSGRGISMETGNISNREATRPSISEVTLSKQMDASSGGLHKEALTGVEGIPVEIHIVQTGTKKVQKYAVYNFSDVLISSYSISASSSGAPVESFSLSFSKFEADLSNTDKSHKNSGTVKFGYDLATASPL